MGIKINNNSVQGVYIQQTPVLAVYINGQLVWPEQSPITDVMSCFAAGYWIDEHPWTDDAPWTD